jgi:hypothetical protein
MKLRWRRKQMNNPTSTGSSERKKTVASFSLLLFLIGSTISALLGLMVSPQQVWAAAPGTPNGGLAPAANFVTPDTTPTFSWNRIVGANAATQYRIQIDDDSNTFVAPILIEATVTQPSANPVSFTVPGNSAFSPGDYFWHVRAENNDGNSAYTSTRTLFVVDTVINSATDGNNNAVTGAGSTKSTSITFALSVTPTATIDHFVCTIDGGAEINPCVSPKQFTGLSSSSHVFTVAAVDSVG